MRRLGDFDSRRGFIGVIGGGFATMSATRIVFEMRPTG